MASSSVCCETSCRLYSSSARSYACFACTSSALRLLHVRRLLDRRQVLAGRARRTARARAPASPAADRGVLLLLAIELHEHLAGRHAIAEVGEDPAHLALGLRRHRDLVHGRQRADDLDGAADRFLADASTWTGLAVVSRPRACAVSVFEQPVATKASAAAMAAKKTCFMS